MESATIKTTKTAAGFEQYRRSKTSTNARFLIAGAVIAIAAVTLVFVAMQGSAVYYVSVKQFKAQEAMLTSADKEVRVAGKVVPGTISKDSMGTISFLATDKEDKALSLKVSYAKLPPDTFKDDSEVVVTGHYKNGVFVANEMLAKCPSKYSSTPEAQ